MTTLDFARRYLDAGLSLLPIAADGSKAPDGRLLPRVGGKASWSPLRERPPTAAQAALWWGGERPAGIGVVCGPVSKGAEVIDFDADDLYAPWCALVEEQAPGLLARLCVVKTPRPAHHVWLLCPACRQGSQKLASDPALRPDRRTLIETRGDGGYALVPGCPPGCHENRRCYEHAAGPALWDLAPVTPEEREALLVCARSLSREVQTLPVPSAAATGVDARPGDEFDRRGPDWAEILGAHGWTLAGAAGEERRWRRPGKGLGWSATTGRCKGKDGADLLRVFSSNAAPLEAGKAYGKFRAWAILQHNGDLPAAAKELAGKGYGAPRARQGNGAAAPPAEPSLPQPPSWPAPPAPEAFHGLAGDVVRLIGPETEADPVALLLTFLACFGSAAGRCRYRAVGVKRHHGNLFVCLVGRTAKGRKGTSLDWIESLFALADPRWAAECVQSGLSSGEGLINAVRDPLRKGQDFEEGAADKRLLVVEEEFSSPLRLAARDGNILSAVLRQAWDGGRLRTLTRHSPLRATDAHVSLLGHVTRDELLRCLAQVDVANGFANRFLWAAVRRSKLLPDGGRVLDLRPAAARLRGALEFAGAAAPVGRTADAGLLWHDAYPRLTAERLGAFGLATNRAEPQVIRLALLYALLDGADALGVPHFRAALALWDYCERSCRWIFGESTGNADADEILHALRAAGAAGLSARDLHAVFNGHRTARQLADALAVLRDGGQARVGQTDTGGRPAQRWYPT